ncbi:glycosyltransferase [Candidatus Curtissbacteria bacterium]|nr:glycosyltransferase [Candidatus Curtissbacteria bacterium]
MIASVVVITKNQKDLFKKSLPIILNQKLKGSYEIIVVDSGSTDGAVEYIKSLPVKLVQIRLEKFNYAFAFNKGASQAKGEYLIRLSGDCIPLRSDFIRELIGSFKDNKVGGAYGKYTISGKKGYGYPSYWPASRFPKELVRYSTKRKMFTGIVEIGKARTEIFNFAGGCCAIRKSIWVKRPFNEKLSEGEDAEYAWFLHTAGYDIVYNPKAVVLHEHKLKFGYELYKWFKPHNLRFWYEILKYWFLRIFGIDLYRDVRQEVYT